MRRSRAWVMLVTVWVLGVLVASAVSAFSIAVLGLDSLSPRLRGSVAEAGGALVVAMWALALGATAWRCRQARRRGVRRYTYLRGVGLAISGFALMVLLLASIEAARAGGAAAFYGDPLNALLQAGQTLMGVLTTGLMAGVMNVAVLVGVVPAVILAWFRILEASAPTRPATDASA